MQPNSLSHKLEQYSTTAKGQSARGKSAAELLGYAAAAGASLAMAGTADAAIIYSGVQNLSTQIDPGAQAIAFTYAFARNNNVAFNMGGNNIYLSAFAVASTIRSAGAGGGGNGTAAFYRGIGALHVFSSGAHFLAGTGSTFVGANLAASHADVGPGAGNFNATSAGWKRDQTAPGGVGGNFGHFPIGVTGFVGVQLSNGDYGWIRLRVDDLAPNQPYTTLKGGTPFGAGLDLPDKITVIDWAFQDNGTAIHVGDTVQAAVPEPSSLALLAAGAAGIGAFRRRKAATAAH